MHAYIWEEIAQYNCGRSLSPPPFRMACAQRKEGKRRVVKTRDFFSFWGKWGQCTARRFSFLFLSTYFYGKDKHVFRAREREVETIFHMIRRGQNCYFKCGYYAGKTRRGGPREKKKGFFKKMDDYLGNCFALQYIYL